jgi:hypothetical protein
MLSRTRERENHTARSMMLRSDEQQTATVRPA